MYVLYHVIQGTVYSIIVNFTYFYYLFYTIDIYIWIISVNYHYFIEDGGFSVLMDS